MLFSEHQIKGNSLIFAVAFAYIAVNTLFIAKGFYYLLALPLVIGLLWLTFSSLDKLIFLIVFFVPLSIPLSRITGNADLDLYLPTEPLLAGVMLLFFLKLIRGQSIDIRILRHPVSVAIYFNIAWILITSITSTQPVVSFKFLAARIWFIISFYFLAVQIFKSGNNIRIYLWAYLIPMIFVIFYVIIKLSGYGLTNQQASNFVVDPFFKDHTSYGAILAMLIPPVIGLFIVYRKINIWFKTLLALMVIVFLAALVLSYTRAAWLSLAAAFGIWILIRLKIKWHYIILVAVLVIVFLFSMRTELLFKIQQNKQTSSGKFIEHLQSISNVRNDVSNLERLNRWNCAVRMFKERPVFGWGPGTYMFQYAPFQKSWEKTIISTNAGTMGNAHSEFLGPLSEQGVFGLVSILSIVSLTLWTGFRVYARAEKKKLRVIILSVLLGLCTYYIHGIMNNFLDTDKASALFWGFSAMLVAADIYHKNKN